MKVKQQISVYHAAKSIVNRMCHGGFMSGWFGDIDQEFRDEQVWAFRRMTCSEKREWVERNRGNLTRYCRVPGWVLEAACEAEACFGKWGAE